jgi:sarcosine oxidase subunit beta
MHYSYPPEVQLALASLQMFQHWRDVVGAEGDFRKTGFVRIVHPGEGDRLKQNVEMQSKLGVNVRLIDRHELKELEPDWQVDEVELAAYEPDSGYGDGAGVANDLLTRARELGVNYFSKTDAVEFLIENGHVRGVRTDQGEIAAPLVVAATGPWTRPLFQRIGIDLPIETEYHQVAILKNAPAMKGGGCACIDSVSATYFRSDAHDKFLIGDFYGQRPVDPDNFPQRASDDGLEEIIERASRRIPKLENAEVMRGVTGVYDSGLAASPRRSFRCHRIAHLCRLLRYGFQDLPRDWPGDVGAFAGGTRQDSRHQFVLPRPICSGQTDQGRVRIQRRLIRAFPPRQ